MAAELAWHVRESRGALAAALAATVSEALGAAIAARGAGFLAVSGGSTPALFFSELSKAAIDWSKVTVTLIDERMAPPSSPRSNARLVMDRLLVGPASAARFLPLYHEADSVEAAATVANAGLGAAPWPLDVAVLGMGTDGHTASFFPDAEGLDALLDPSAGSILMPVHAQSAVEDRLTLTMKPIISAGLLALHIEGAEKRAVLERALGPGERLPIRAVFDSAERPVQIFWAE